MIAARQVAFGRGRKREAEPAYGGLCFTAERAGSTLALTAVGTAPAVSLETSTDGIAWDIYTVGDTITLAKRGEKVFFRSGEGGNTTFGSSTTKYHKFVMSGEIAASGDITSLLNREMVDVELADYCCCRMFYGCTSLVTAPELPATTLASRCYYDMFYGCTSLVTAPELPATTLAIYCYSRMFRDCTSLVTAPELPATTLATYCYTYMFYGCTSLNYIKVGFQTWSNPTSNWTTNVSAHGTFYKPSALPEEFAANRIPAGWTVVNVDEA